MADGEDPHARLPHGRGRGNAPLTGDVSAHPASGGGANGPTNYKGTYPHVEADC